eukprot:scaffold73339_cov60-Phaeocystis_antarctica.AAC.9
MCRSERADLGSPERASLDPVPPRVRAAPLARSPPHQARGSRTCRFAPAGTKGGGIGGCGGRRVGWLGHPKRWLGAQWPCLSRWEGCAAQSRQRCPEEAQAQSSGTVKAGV